MSLARDHEYRLVTSGPSISSSILPPLQAVPKGKGRKEDGRNEATDGPGVTMSIFFFHVFARATNVDIPWALKER